MKELVEKTWSRKCPKCQRDILHKSKKYYLKSFKKNILCKSCGNPFRGKTHSVISKQKMSNAKKGNDYGKYRKITEELCKKISKSKLGIKPWNKGKIGVQPKSDETRKKISESLQKGGKMKGDKNPSKRPEVKVKLRKAYIQQIKNLKGDYKVMYNPFACKVIEAYGKRYGYNFQHAENGGEIYIKELGYTLDGYDREKNVVIEYYENSFKHRKREERDLQRENEIREHLKCDFIVIREWEEKDKQLIKELLN